MTRRKDSSGVARRDGDAVFRLRVASAPDPDPVKSVDSVWDLTADKIITEREWARALGPARVEVDLLIGAWDPRRLAHVNDYYVFVVGYLTGLRVSELSDLDWDDVDLEGGALVVRRGKGNRRRTVHFGARVTDALVELLRIQERMMGWVARGEGSRRPVFMSPKNRRRLGRSGMHRRFKEVARAARIRDGLSMHSLRHGYATRMLDSGVPLHVLQKQLGHASIETTAIYLHFTKAAADAVKNAS